MRTVELEPQDGRRHEDAPADDDALHAYIVNHFGVSIPRKSVCDGHAAPFDAFADLHFERVDSALWVTNRGGSKSWGAALWHFLGAKFRPGCEGITVGAILEQSRRVYAHLLDLIRKDGNVGHAEEHRDIDSSIMSGTRWRNGSEVSILPGSQKAVNGPHVPHLHLDELELMDMRVASEAMAIPNGTKNGVSPQVLQTSTRKRAHGAVESLMSEIEQAESQGFEPSAKLYTWCIFECAAPVENCGGGCGCERIQSGKWTDGSPRTFDTVCGGRLKNSDGWLSLRDVWATFKRASRDFWEAQHTCERASREGLVYPMYGAARHLIRSWDPDPSLGSIFTATDFGSANPTAVLWIQVLNQDVEVTAADGTPKTLLKFTRVVFHEYYRAQVTSEDTAAAVLAIEAKYRERFPSFKVLERYGDPQARDARGIWRSRGLNIIRRATKDLRLSIGYVAQAFDHDLLALSAARVQHLPRELTAYHYPDAAAGQVDSPDEPVKDFDHACDALRYGVKELRARDKLLAQQGIATATEPLVAAVDGNVVGSVTGAGISPWRGGGRRDLGGARGAWGSVRETFEWRDY